MTVWKAGMLAVCVDASPSNQRRVVGELVEGRTYQVRGITHHLHPKRPIGLLLTGMPDARNGVGELAGWDARRFRPAVEDRDPCEEEFITLLKRSKPAKQPVNSDNIILRLVEWLASRNGYERELM